MIQIVTLRGDYQHQIDKNKLGHFLAHPVFNDSDKLYKTML